MKLIKHFDFTNMNALDLNDWNIEVGDKWANNEIQRYVNKPENHFFDNGLVIQATNTNGIIESTRINTKNKFSFKYGKIDIIAKVPNGKGTWPALWMMSQNTIHGGWPRSGEIDIMEHTAKDLDHLYLCLHTEAYNHRQEKYYYFRKHVEGLTNNFQKFTLLWEENLISYYLNDELLVAYEKGKDGWDESHKGWPFNDDEFYLIINLAIGGGLGGPVDFQNFPQQFIVKDIKIYQ
ncbi:glycoside hydrolase family 16 protein [Liberiplasma polymorphum]|uniref:glycoside hydrolase family 16 protein n=1 Tax=Liberiplasma polymorphum TaxID=3374570 RepID=UPI0037748313